MGVELIVTRRGREPIALPEWTEIVARDRDFQMRTNPYEATNPRTGEVVRILAGEGDAELRVGDRWLPFLRYRNGKLATPYVPAFEDVRNPARLKIAAIAKQLAAVITTDAGDELLDW